MKKLIILAMILALMVMATAVLAGPGGPWYLSNAAGETVPPELPASCPHPSGFTSVWYTNAITEDTRCFLK